MRRSLVIKVWIFAVMLGLLAYFCAQILRYLEQPFSSALAYTYRVEQTVALSGYVVRQEEVLGQAGAGFVRLRREEGERVSAGGTVAAVYPDQASLEAQDEMDALEARISQLEFAQASMLGAEASVQLDAQIVRTLLAHRAAVSAGRLDTAREQGQTLRSLVLRRDFAYSGTADLSGQIQDLKGQLRTLEGRTAASVRTVRSDKSALFSAVVDGYERILTPQALPGLLPSDIDALAPTEAEGVGRLILGNAWYYVCTVSAQEAQTLQRQSQQHKTLTLQFLRGVDRTLEVTLQSVSREEDGRCAVVLRGETYLQELTLLRRQSAQVILSVTAGIRVPRSAVRVLTQTVTKKDPDTGEETAAEQTVTGVYCLSGARVRFKPAQVLYTAEGFALLRPSGSSEQTRLRTGDQVIVSGRGLYDGKVVA